MAAAFHKGKLKQWNDERGFGFIQPDPEADPGGQDVFLHISALKTPGRRPKAEDILFYRLGQGRDGRPCAVEASIQGVLSPASRVGQPSQRQAGQRQRQSKGQKQSQASISHPKVIKLLLVLGITAVVGLFQSLLSPSTPPTAVSSPPATRLDRASSEGASASPSPRPGCVIKGNISFSSGKKFYHLPGMRDYEITVIDPLKGERWFCSEKAAIAAGWQKAPTPRSEP